MQHSTLSFQDAWNSAAARGALGANRLERSRFPIVDVSSLFGEDGQAIGATAHALGQAARSNGFLYITGHGISRDLIDSTYQQAEQFFALTDSEKLRLRIGSTRHHRGYVPTSDRGLYLDEAGERHYDAFDLGLDVPATERAARDSFLTGPNLWPKLPAFKSVVSHYYNSVSKLAERLFFAFEIDLGLEPGFFAERMRRPTSQLRLIHYQENDAPLSHTDMNMGAHTDYECFTILNQTSPGLQVMDLNDQWVEVPPIPGTLVINIGDMLEAWTNGAYTATLHRVVNHGRERYSMPYFAAVDEHVKVEPLPQFVDHTRPAAYQPLVAGEHLLSQMVRDFSYMRDRIARGQMPSRLLPKSELSLFEQRRPITQASRNRAAA